jgi:hypothetical protein
MRKITGSLVWVVAVLLVAVAMVTFFCGCEPDDNGTPPPPPPLIGHALAIGLN